MSTIVLSWSEPRSFRLASALQDLISRVLRDQGSPLAAIDVESASHRVTLVGLDYALDSLEKRARREPGRAVPGDILDRIDTAIERWNRPPGEPQPPVAGRWDANNKVRRVHGAHLNSFRLQTPCRGVSAP